MGLFVLGTAIQEVVLPAALQLLCLLRPSGHQDPFFRIMKLHIIIGLFVLAQVLCVVRSEEAEEVVAEDPPPVAVEEPAPKVEAPEEVPEAALNPVVTSTIAIIVMAVISILCIIGLWKKGQGVLTTSEGEQAKKEE